MGVDQAKQLVIHGVGLGLLRRAQRLRRTLVQMIFHQVARHAAQGLLRRSNLHDDIGAVAVVFQHLLQPANLTFNAAQAFLIAEFQLWIDGHRFVAGANHAGALTRMLMCRVFCGQDYIPPAGIYTPTPYRMSRTWKFTKWVTEVVAASLQTGSFSSSVVATFRSPASSAGKVIPTCVGRCYNAAMTLLELKYALVSPLTNDQLQRLGEFANTYGLRKFRLNDARTELSFEYDASRLRDTQVVHVLGQAKIAVAKRLN